MNNTEELESSLEFLKLFIDGHFTSWYLLHIK